MAVTERYDIVIVGMGSGGMVAAEFAASLGKKVLVVERDRVGGDCLWTGCVPSKALLASAKVAHHMRTADRFGITAVEPDIDRAKVWERVRSVQEHIARGEDDPDRFRRMGIELIIGEAARLSGTNTVAVGDREYSARFVLLATGSRPFVPAIAGLDAAGYLTSESLFQLSAPPSSMVVVGAGPVGIEMAQACRRLGMRVTVLQKGDRVLPRDEPSLARQLSEELRNEGVDIELGVDIKGVRVENGHKIVEGTVAGRPARWEADELLVATGRSPNIEGLGLDEVGVKTAAHGVIVDDRLRTSVPNIYAAGDVAGRFLFTHSAAFESVRAVRDAFFPGKGTFTALVPWCTFTDPELAHAGMTTAEATARFGKKATTFELPLSHNDRAVADGAVGRVVLVTGPRGKLVGAHILAPAAGEVIHELAFAIHDERRLADLAKFVHLYPTVATAVGQLAGEAVFDGVQRYRWVTKLARKG